MVARPCRKWVKNGGPEPVECLDRGLLVDAENRGVPRRIDVEPDHIGSLRLELGIIGRHVPLESIRLQPSARPHARDHHVMSTELLGALATAPVRRAVGWPAPRPCEDAGFESRRPFRHGPAAMAGHRPASRAVSNRRFQRLMSPVLPARASWIAVYEVPPASVRIIRARRTSSARSARERAREASSSGFLWATLFLRERSGHHEERPKQQHVSPARGMSA